MVPPNLILKISSKFSEPLETQKQPKRKVKGVLQNKMFWKIKNFLKLFVKQALSWMFEVLNTLPAYLKANTLQNL